MHGSPGLIVILAGLAASPALGAKDPLKVQLIPKALRGQPPPTLVVHAETELVDLVLDVQRSSDHRQLRQDAGHLPAGAEFRFPLSADRAGEARFTGTLAIMTANGRRAEMPIDVTTTVLDPIVIKVRRDEIDLETRTLEFATNRPVEKAEITVIGDTGKVLGTTSVKLDPAEDVSEYTVSWRQAKGTVLKMIVNAYDADGFFGISEFYPWNLELPHREVSFLPKQATMPPNEIPKLGEVYRKHLDVVHRLGKIADLKLYICVHTDTVGEREANLALSTKRAQVLARWFQQRGMRIPIFYAGFGEELPLVETPDETSEPRNRRVEYFIAVEPPPQRGTRFTRLEAK